MFALDHLVVAADSLAQGVRWCEGLFGVTPGQGGQHPLMGTHNRLLRVATETFADAYLEIIAIDPEAPPPGRVRWFGLDEPALRERLRQRPRLLHAVFRTDALDELRAALATAGHDPGAPVEARRDTAQGPLHWRITVRDDGRLAFGGALPTLIEWRGRHPAASMPASGVRLGALALAGLPEAVQRLLPLPAVGFGPAGEPALRATLSSPRGAAILASDPG